MNNLEKAISGINTQPVTPAAPPAYNPPTVNWATIQPNRDQIQIQLALTRTSRGLTQRQLANICGLSATTINRAEKGLWVSLTTLFKIARGLNTNITLA